jgi:hypothetical protein
MQEAIEHARAGETPIIVISSRAQESYFRNLWEHLGGEPRAVTFMTPAQEFSGLRSPALFVDHYAFEVGYDNASLDYLLNRYSKEAGAE